MVESAKHKDLPYSDDKGGPGDPAGLVTQVAPLISTLFSEKSGRKGESREEGDGSPSTDI